MRITAVILLSLLFVASLNAQGACAGPGSNNVVRISSLAEYNAVKDCVTMNGLQVTTANLPFALIFSQLTTLGNAISVSNATGLTSIEMPLLATTTGQISITGCPDITKIIIGADSATGITQGTSANMVFTELPAITDIRVGVKTAQRVSVTAVGKDGNTGALSFPALTTVTPQAVSISSSKFGTVSFASLTSTGSVTLNNNDVGVVNFPKNLTTTGFTVTNNRGMTSVTINPIQIGTADRNVDFQFSDNKGGSYGLRLDSLTAVNGKFLVNGNDGLTSLVIPKSFGTQQVSISGNGLNSADIAYCVVAGDADVSNNAPTTGAPGAVNLGFGKVGGSLFVAQNTFGALTFGALQAVGGLVRLDTNNADSISFPSTFLAAGNITLLQNTLTSATTGNLDVSGIQGTNGSLLIQNNKNDNKVSALVFRDLQFVAGQFLIDTNNFVNSISVPSLKIVGALSGGSQYKGDESTSFIVQNNEKLLTFNGTGSGLFIIVGNLTISNNDAITTINADSLGQAGALSIQRDAALTSFSANGLVCAAIVEFNSVNALRTVSLTSVSRIEQSLVIAQGGEGDKGPCAASINSTSGAACTGGTPACYNCQGNQGGASNCGSPIAALAALCGSDKSFCPVARALALIDPEAGPTVDGAGTFGQGSGTTRASSATTPGNGNTSPGNTVSTQQNSAVSNIAAIFLVAVALFAGF